MWHVSSLPLLSSRLLRGAGAAPGGGGAGAPGAGPGRAEEAVSGPDGDSGEAERRQGGGPRGGQRFHSRGSKDRRGGGVEGRRLHQEPSSLLLL